MSPNESPPASPRKAPARPVVFGEVLFDVFPDAEVLGGAAFNLAWNLEALGAEPLIVTRVGSDERGQRIVDAMRAWGMETRGVQVDPQRASGYVSVSVRDGEPSFDIVENVAWDFIDAEEAVAAVGDDRATVLYHGSLATRSPASRQALERLIASTELPRFVDINLRAPWWDRARVVRLLRGASSVKLNENELKKIGEDKSDGSPERHARAFREELGIDRLIVTCGGDGALLVSADAVARAPSPPVDDLKDTVGAGDAFAAVALLGAHHGWSPETIVERAVAFAARICGLRGATTERRELYDATLRSWK